MVAFIIYITVLAVTFLLGISYLEEFPTVLLCIELAFGAVSIVYAVLAALTVKIEITNNDGILSTEDRVLIRGRVKSRFLVPIFHGKIRFRFSYQNQRADQKYDYDFSLSSGKTMDLEIPVEVSYAGILEIKPVFVLCYGFADLGMGIQVLNKYRKMSLYLLPEPVAVPIELRLEKKRYMNSQFLQKWMDEGTMYLDRAGDCVEELYGFRPYRPGDRLQRVEWKLTEKTGEVMVKEYLESRECSILIRLDLACLSRNDFHARIQIFFSVAESIILSGHIFAAAWYEKNICQAVIKSEEELYELLCHLISLPFSKEISLAEMERDLENEAYFQNIIYVSDKMKKEEYHDICLDQTVNRVMIAAGCGYSGEIEQKEQINFYVLDEENLKEELANLLFVLE